MTMTMNLDGTGEGVARALPGSETSTEPRRLPTGAAAPGRYPGFLDSSIPSFSLGSAVRASAVAALTALTQVVTHNPFVAAGLMAVAVAVVPQPRPTSPSARRPQTPAAAADLDWAEELEGSCHRDLIAAYRRGEVPAASALASFTWVADWNARQGMEESVSREHIQEAIAVARHAGDRVALIRLELAQEAIEAR